MPIKTSPTKKQKKKPRDPNKPKQAMSAFFIYMNTARAEIKEGLYNILSIPSPKHPTKYHIPQSHSSMVLVTCGRCHLFACIFR